MILKAISSTETGEIEKKGAIAIQMNDKKGRNFDKS